MGIMLPVFLTKFVDKNALNHTSVDIKMEIIGGS